MNNNNPLQRPGGQTAYNPEQIFDEDDRIGKGDSTGVEAGLAAIRESLQHAGDAIDGDAEAARKIQTTCSEATVKSDSYSGIVDDDVNDRSGDVDASSEKISKSGHPKTVESYRGAFDGVSDGKRDQRLKGSEDDGTGNRRLSEGRN